MYTQVYTRIHTYTRSIYKCKQVYTVTTFVNTSKHMYTQAYAGIYTYANVYTDIHKYAQIYTGIQLYLHLYARAYMVNYICIHKYSRV